MRRAISWAASAVIALGTIWQFGKWFLDWAGRLFAMRDLGENLTHAGWLGDYAGLGSIVGPWILIGAGVISLASLHLLPIIQRRRPSSEPPFATIQIKMQPRGSNDPFEVIAKIDGLRRQDGVTVLVRYAEAIHSMASARWEWSQSYRLIEHGNILPNETWTPTVLMRLHDGDDVVSGTNYKTYKVGDDILLLVEIRAISNATTVTACSVFQFRNVRGARLSEPVRLDDVNYIEGLEA